MHLTWSPMATKFLLCYQPIQDQYQKLKAAELIKTENIRECVDHAI